MGHVAAFSWPSDSHAKLWSSRPIWFSDPKTSRTIQRVGLFARGERAAARAAGHRPPAPAAAGLPARHRVTRMPQRAGCGQAAKQPLAPLEAPEVTAATSSPFPGSSCPEIFAWRDSPGAGRGHHQHRSTQRWLLSTLLRPLLLRDGRTPSCPLRSTSRANVVDASCSPLSSLQALRGCVGQEA